MTNILKDRINEIINSKKWLNRSGKRASNIRSKNFEQIILSSAFDHFGIISERDFALEEFRGAVERYLLGFYYDSIYLSCMSVELALLTLLNENLPDEEKNKIYNRINKKRFSFTFGQIRHECEVFNLISEQQVEKINEILSIRNTQAHSYNYLSALISSNKYKISQHPDAIKKILSDKPDLKTKLALSYVKLITGKDLRKSISTMRSLPEYKWCSSNNLREIIENEYQQYFIEIEKNLDLLLESSQKLDIKNIITATIKLVEFLDKDIYFKNKSRNTLELSFEILKSLDFIV